MLLDTLKRLECFLHGSRRKDRKWLEQILHERFSEITRSGVFVDRAQTIEALSGKIAFQLFSVVISGLSSLEIISQFCTIELSIQMAVVHLFVLHAGKFLRMGNGNWCSIREHLRQRACSRQIQRPFLAQNRLSDLIVCFQ